MARLTKVDCERSNPESKMCVNVNYFRYRNSIELESYSEVWEFDCKAVSLLILTLINCFSFSLAECICEWKNFWLSRPEQNLITKIWYDTFGCAVARRTFYPKSVSLRIYPRLYLLGREKFQFLVTRTVSIILWFSKLKCWLSIKIDPHCWLL